MFNDSAAIEDVAVYFIDLKYKATGEIAMSQNELECYLYYLWCYSLAWFNVYPFSAPIYAVKSGVSIPMLYERGTKIQYSGLAATMTQDGKISYTHTRNISFLDCAGGADYHEIIKSVADSVFDVFSQMNPRIIPAYIINEAPWSRAMWTAARENDTSGYRLLNPVDAVDYYSHKLLPPVPVRPSISVNPINIPSAALLYRKDGTVNNPDIKTPWTPAWLDEQIKQTVPFSERAAGEVRRSENRPTPQAAPIPRAQQSFDSRSKQRPIPPASSRYLQYPPKPRYEQYEPVPPAAVLRRQLPPELDQREPLEAHIDKMQALSRLAKPIDKDISDAIAAATKNIDSLLSRVNVLRVNYDFSRFDSMMVRLYKLSYSALLDPTTLREYKDKLVETAKAIEDAALRDLRILNERHASTFLADMDSLLASARGTGLSRSIPDVQTDATGLFSNDENTAGTIFDTDPSDDDHPTDASVFIPDVGDIGATYEAVPKNVLLTPERDPNAKLTIDDVTTAAKDAASDALYNIKDTIGKLKK